MAHLHADDIRVFIQVSIMDRSNARSRRGTAGFTLIELLISMGITVAILGATMAAMSSAVKANQTALLMTSMNNNLRTGMDLMIRDMLQVGQGLPTGGVILTPVGAPFVQINLPGPPGSALKNVVGDTDIAAVQPGPGLGPVVNGVATDIITTLAADSAFDHRSLTALTLTSMTVSKPQPDLVAPAECDISNGGPDDVVPGQLMLLTKGTQTTLVQITSVDGNQSATFASGDSLKLNQPTADLGSIKALLAAAPPDVLPAAGNPQYLPTTATRIRMITYYLDVPAATPTHPRLIRRMNNGDPLTFNNALGNVVAFDVESLQISYDLNDGATNPSYVKMVAADTAAAGTGACTPNPCSVNQIRKVNVVLMGRSTDTLQGLTGRFLRNSLASQISLRSLAFVDRYR